MKKCSIVATLILTLALLFALSACGGDSGEAADSPYIGLWTATSTSMSGLEMSVEDLFSEGFTVDLKGNGKCEMNFDGDNATGKWSEENGAITISDGDMDITGTIDESTMVLELGDGISLTLTR